MGKKPSPPSSSIPDTEEKKMIRKAIYPMAGRAMEGKGFGTPELMAKRRETIFGGLETAHAGAKGALISNLARMVRSGDTGVKSYAHQVLDRNAITKQDQAERMFRMEKEGDKDIGSALSLGMLSGERRMSIDTTQAYNRALTQNALMEQQMGTFGTNVGGGVASGAMDYMYAQQMSKKA